jgi:hypothetical protein
MASKDGKRGRKGFGEELGLLRRYSELSDLYFQRLRERLTSEDKNEQNFGLQLLNGVFTKMIPQEINGDFTSENYNHEATCTKAEEDAVKKALSASVPDTASTE